VSIQLKLSSLSFRQTEYRNPYNDCSGVSVSYNEVFNLEKDYGDVVKNFAKRETVRDLSPAQLGIWVAQQLAPDSSVYNIADYVEILGSVDPKRFETALRRVVEENDAHHIQIVETDNGPQQYIDSNLEWVMPFMDVSTESDPRAAAEAWMYDDIGRVIDLTGDPLFGYALFRLAPDRFLWYGRHHHLCTDGFGVSLIAQRVAELYSALAENRTPDSTERLSWFDLLNDDEDYRLSAHYARDRDYWRKQIAARPSPVTLSGKLPARSPVSTCSTHYLAVPDADILRARCTFYQVSFPQIVTAAAAVYLHRLSGETDFTLGIPLTARVGSRMRSIVGNCVNVLPLRLTIGPNDGLDSLLQQVSRGMRQMLRHQRFRSEDLRRDLGVRPDEPKIYGTKVNVMNFVYDLRFGGHRSVVHNLSNGPVDDLQIVVYDRKEGSDVRIDFRANPEHYTEEELASHQRRFMALLAQVATVAPDLPLHGFEMLDDRERHTILDIFNATAADYPKDQCIHQLFEEQVEKTPAAVAVIFENQQLTYRELNSCANQLAKHLRSLGVGPGVLVGICVERSLEMMRGLFAILKAGGTYVPLDPAFPRERLDFMLEDSQSSVLLTQKKFLGLLPSEALQVVCLDSGEDDISQEDQENLERIAAPEDIAYVLYTSGSTGKPKGVEISHRALTNFLWSMRSNPGCTERDVLLAVTTLSFDIAGLELYLPLIVGGCVDLVSREVAVDGLQLKERIERCRPTLLQATPATWRMLIDAGWSGTPGMTALCGGEGLPRELANQLLDRTAALWNMYGPTETTIWSSIHRVSPSDSEITIGRPIANTDMYILDQNLRPVPVGVSGELFIGGDGLARGYRNRPQLTAERFIHHPFAEAPGTRLYRTGDLARYREDGCIVHLGRLDHQVKLRGFRIEMGEVEAALVEHESVGQAVVMVREDRPGDQYLAAYVIAAPGQIVLVTVLRQHLLGKLPDYMVPQQIVELDAFPLTPNGKIDRKRLPVPERRLTADTEVFIHPRNPTEESIAQIFADLLGVPQVGIYDNFFDLGGHSLLAVRAISSIANTFNVRLPLQVLFEAPTVAALSNKLADVAGIPQTVETDAFASSANRREPRTTTERRLLAIWELFFPERQIGVCDNFFDLQGRGNLVDQMLEEVKRIFGVVTEGLPVSAFLEQPTIEVLARIIDAAFESTSSLVVCLQPHGFKRPLFLIHAGGGYVFFFRALALRIGRDYPVYAIRAETKADGFGRPYDQSESIEDLAARYIREIKTVQPKGPYCLGGACSGGVVAFEMARQLRAQGEYVTDPVLLFDSFVFNNPHARTYQEAILRNMVDRVSLRNRIVTHLRRASRVRVKKAMWYLASALIRTMRRGWGKVNIQLVELKWKVYMALGGSMPLELEQSRITASFMKATERLLSKYTPGEYDGSIALFKASEGLDAEPLWSGLALRSMAIHEIPGSHLDMMEEPTVMTTAALVANYLEGVEQVSQTTVEWEAPCENLLQIPESRPHSPSVTNHGRFQQEMKRSIEVSRSIQVVD
jgi:amino acid adenylation domain-containing protein